jgi:hypothetical protein
MLLAFDHVRRIINIKSTSNFTAMRYYLISVSGTGLKDELNDSDPCFVLETLHRLKDGTQPLTYLAIICLRDGETYPFSLENAIAGKDPHLRALAWRTDLPEKWALELLNGFDEEILVEV